MSPSKKRKKGKQRQPPPRYRKQKKTETSGGKTAAAPEPGRQEREPGAAGATDGAEPPGPLAPAQALPASHDLTRPQAGRTVSLDPLSPIIVRSGRPMNAHTDADPAQFPPPSTVAGCLRTAWARAADRPFGPELAQLAVAGPLLMREDGRVLAPKPADALYFGHGTSARCLRAKPQRFDGGCGTDLPAGLLPVRLTRPVADKPGDGPAWWSWQDLLAFRGGEDVPIERLASGGWSPPEGDRRTHVSIDASTGAAATGKLYETEGLDLGASPPAFRASTGGPTDGASAGARSHADSASPGDLRLLVRCEEALAPALVHLGGKRRLAALEPEPDDRWPTPPDGWLERIGDAGGLCLTLLTPGVFAAGYRPGWLDDTLTGSPAEAPNLRLRLRAAAVERWRPHSGWDLAQRRPRPTRKLVPAGATYWFEVLGACDVNALTALWLASVCDEPQDRRDGFGLALPAPWTPPADEANQGQ